MSISEHSDIGKFMRARTTLIPLITLIVFASPALGSCFSVFENGVRASGMAGAFVAVADDGSALFYNPAGIAFQKGMRMQADMVAIAGLFRYFPSNTPPGTIVPDKGYNLNNHPHMLVVGGMYMTKDVSPKMTFGFGMFAPFGLAANATNFKDSDPANTKYVGRFAGTRGKLESFWMQPTAGYRLTEDFSVGIGVALVHTHILIERSIINPYGSDAQAFGENLASKIFPGADPGQAGKVIARMLPEGRSRLAGTGNRPGFTAGLLWKNARTRTSIGLMWRSAVTNHLAGKASFAFTTGYPLESFIGKDTIPNLFPTQPMKGSFTTPATYSIGVATRAFFKSTFSFQFDLQDYRRFNSVPVNFSQTVDNGTALPKELRLNFEMQNSYVLRAAVERNLGERNSIRFGYFFDRTPVKDASVGALFPDSSRNNLTVGASHFMGNKEFTFFYQAMWLVERTTYAADNVTQFTNGTYSNFVHLVGLGMRLRMGASANPFDR
jgi:long-chain fatty acid transport protein